MCCCRLGQTEQLEHTFSAWMSELPSTQSYRGGCETLQDKRAPNFRSNQRPTGIGMDIKATYLVSDESQATCLLPQELCFLLPLVSGSTS